IFDELERQARADVTAEGVPGNSVETRQSLDLRYQGADASLTISRPGDGDYAASFAAEHRRLYGYIHENRPLETVAARVEAIGRSQTILPASHALKSKACPPHGSQPLYFDGEFHSAALYRREELTAGTRIVGPAIIVEPLTTTIIDPGWEANVLSGGELLIESATAKRNHNPAHNPAPNLAP